MKPLSKIEDLKSRPDVIRSKRLFGLLYGLTAGLAFAISSWGWDGYLLSTAHGYFPWVKLVAGAILCGGFGGMAGWLTERFESGFLGLFLWLLSALFFAWTTFAIPLQVTPLIVSSIDPQLGQLFNYGQDIGYTVRFGVALAWILPFTLLIGVAQLPIVEPAVFATSFFGKLLPLIYCIIVMGIAGITTDNLINMSLRTAVVAMDRTIQFVVDNKDNENIDKALSRKMYTASLRNVKDLVGESRLLFVGSYDEYLGDIHVLVKFSDQWIECNVVYGQPVNCKIPAEK